VHLNNPLHLPQPPNYFQEDRAEIIAALMERGIYPDYVLELGCSSGAFGQALKKQLGAKFYAGLEIDAQAAELARQKLDQVYEINLDHDSIQTLKFTVPSFDLLVALDVLEHLLTPGMC